MGKGEVFRNSYMNDDDKKEVYLKELGDSLHNYIRTGVKNEQLDDLVELEEVFQERYEERFDIQKITEMISQSSKRKVTEIEKRYIQEIKEIDNKTKEKNIFKCSIEQASAQIISTVIDILCDKLQNVVRDAAYLSHVNMLYELYEREERLRREEQEYEKISEEYQKMANIASNLSKRRRMEIEQLEKQVNMSQEELEYLLNQNQV